MVFAFFGLQGLLAPGLGLSRQRGSLVAIPGFVCATVLYIKFGFYLNLDTFPGGHTAEMITLLKKMDFSFYRPRHYVVAETDRMSSNKAATLESNLSENVSEKILQETDPVVLAGAKTNIIAKDMKNLEARSSNLLLKDSIESSKPSWQLHVIPRSREVGQSFFTSFFSTLYALIYAFRTVLTCRPGVLLVNGPGTCIPVTLAACLGNIMGWLQCKIIYVESIARVRRMSLTGKLLYRFHLTDLFVVQWPELQKVYPKSEYLGRVY